MRRGFPYIRTVSNGVERGSVMVRRNDAHLTEE